MNPEEEIDEIKADEYFYYQNHDYNLARSVYKKQNISTKKNKSSYELLIKNLEDGCLYTDRATRVYSKSNIGRMVQASIVTPSVNLSITRLEAQCELKVSELQARTLFNIESIPYTYNLNLILPLTKYLELYSYLYGYYPDVIDKRETFNYKDNEYYYSFCYEGICRVLVTKVKEKVNLISNKYGDIEIIEIYTVLEMKLNSSIEQNDLIYSYNSLYSRTIPPFSHSELENYINEPDCLLEKTSLYSNKKSPGVLINQGLFY